MDLLLELSVERPRCLQGESVRFTVTVTNRGRSAIQGVPMFSDFNKQPLLMARTDSGQRWWGFGLGPLTRDGLAPDLSERPTRTIDLPAGGKETLEGDILHWFGELPADNYRLVALYSAGVEADALDLHSSPVNLRIVPAKPKYVSVPRLPEMPSPGPLTAVWRHESQEGSTWFFQQQSRIRPPNAYHCFSVAGIPAAALPKAATVATADPPVGHLLWAADDRLNILQVPGEAPATAAPVAIAAPFQPLRILDSPRTTDENELLALLSDETGRELVFLQAQPGNKYRLTELPLEAAGPLGQYCLYWTMDNRLEFVWAEGAGHGRNLQYASVLPQDPVGSFTPRQMGTAAGPILRLDLLLDRRAGRKGLGFAHVASADHHLMSPPTQPTGQDAAGPALTLFVLAWQQVPRSLVLTRWSVPAGGSEEVARFVVGDEVAGQPEVLASVMARRKEPVYLLRDTNGKLFYASSVSDALMSIEKLVGDVAKADDAPHLMAATDDADIGWVHLRYVNPKTGGFRSVKIEPADEEDAYSLVKESPLGNR